MSDLENLLHCCWAMWCYYMDGIWIAQNVSGPFPNKCMYMYNYICTCWSIGGGTGGALGARAATKILMYALCHHQRIRASEATPSCHYKDDIRKAFWSYLRELEQLTLVYLSECLQGGSSTTRIDKFWSVHSSWTFSLPKARAVNPGHIVISEVQRSNSFVACPPFCSNLPPPMHIGHIFGHWLTNRT